MSAFWTEKRTDLEGSRWNVWERHYQNVLDWDTFKTQVLLFNPTINKRSRWLFKKGVTYTLPTSRQVVAPPEPGIDLENEIARNRLAQEILKKDGHYTGNIDGIIGRASLLSLNQYPEINVNWPEKRKVVALLQLTANKSNLHAGRIDGYWGPQTEYASEELVELLSTGSTKTWRPEDIAEVNPHKWPTQYRDDFDTFYGPKATNLVRVNFPYPHRLSWNAETSVTRTKCHKMVKQSLERVLNKVLGHYGLEEIKRLKLDIWGGCFNDRPIRGGTKPSMHSWGIAMDYDPANNKLKWGRDRATFAQPEYLDWWRFWEEEGWVSLGRQKNFDWMHVQAAKLV